MYLLKTSASFDSAHFLSGYQGKCANIHGHRWLVEASFYGEMLKPSGSEQGMLMDFADVKREVRALANRFDHTFIYEENTLRAATVEALEGEGFEMVTVFFQPTAENFAKYFFDELRAKGLPVKSVSVYETPENCAVYEEELQCTL